MILLGNRLKELRKRSGLTQEELGRMVNVTKVSICCYENGTRIPTLDTLKDLSNVLNVNIDYLLGNDMYLVADESEDYGVKLSKEELSIILELRKYPLLHNMLINDTVRTVQLIDKKIR